MPVKKHVKVSDGVSWAVWEITEQYQELFDLLPLDQNDVETLEQISHKLKRLEYLAGRLAVKELLVREGLPFEGIYKDEWGKPHLLNSDRWISISNTYPFGVAMFNKWGPAGIDMERISDRPLKISHKFLSPEEFEWAGQDPLILNILWCAKESLYKLFGKKRLNFRDDIAVDQFFPADMGVLSGYLRSEQDHQAHQLHYIRWEDHLICYTI